MDSKGIWGVIGLSMLGVMLAVVVTNPTGVNAAGTQLDNITKTVYAGMLGHTA